MHGHLQERFGARPIRACLVACPVHEITSFVADSSRSRKSVFNCLNHIRLFRDIPELKAQVRFLCKRQFLPQFLPAFHSGQTVSVSIAEIAPKTTSNATQEMSIKGAKRRVTLAGPCPSCRLRRTKASATPATRLLRFNAKSVAPCRRPVTRPVTTKRISVRVSSLARVRSSHRANTNCRKPAPAVAAT